MCAHSWVCVQSPERVNLAIGGTPQSGEMPHCIPIWQQATRATRGKERPPRTANLSRRATPLSVVCQAFTALATSRVSGQRGVHRRLSMQPRGTTVHMASTFRPRTSLVSAVARVAVGTRIVRQGFPGSPVHHQASTCRPMEVMHREVDDRRQPANDRRPKFTPEPVPVSHSKTLGTRASQSAWPAAVHRRSHL